MMTFNKKLYLKGLEPEISLEKPYCRQNKAGILLRKGTQSDKNCRPLIKMGFISAIPAV